MSQFHVLVLSLIFYFSMREFVNMFSVGNYILKRQAASKSILFFRSIVRTYGRVSIMGNEHSSLHWWMNLTLRAEWITYFWHERFNYRYSEALVFSAAWKFCLRNSVYSFLSGSLFLIMSTSSTATISLTFPRISSAKNNPDEANLQYEDQLIEDGFVHQIHLRMSHSVYFSTCLPLPEKIAVFSSDSNKISSRSLSVFPTLCYNS